MWCQVSGARYQVLTVRCQVPSVRWTVPGAINPNNGKPLKTDLVFDGQPDACRSEKAHR